MSSKWVCAAAALCLFAIAIGLYAPLMSPEPYHYDEADYMWAGKQGFGANFMDAHGLSFVEFVRKGLELSKNPGERQSFSEFIRTSGDIGLYRHYHGPVYAYWLAGLQHAGIKAETVFRGSGLLIHGISALLILLGFWSLFPSLPRIAGLVTFALFVFDKTTLSAAMTITQHGIFTLLCIAVLFAASRFIRDYDVRWFYATMALLGISFCAVETTVLLMPGLAIALLIDRKTLRERWPSLGAFTLVLLKGVGVLILAILICWPFGVLQLGIAKGFLTLAYMAVVRRNFSPIGPIRFFGLMYQTSPWEFTVLIAGGIGAFLLWRRFTEKRELLPWLGFIGVFFAVLLKITLPYTYYFAPLAAALTVACGVVFGNLWNRRGAWRLAACLAVLAGITGSTVQFVNIVRESRATRPYEADVLDFLRKGAPQGDAKLYLPFQLVPTLHYYFPEIKTVGYDYDFSLARLIDGVRSPDAAPIMFCEAPMCSQMEAQAPGLTAQKQLLHSSGPNRQPLYVVYVGASPQASR